MPRSRDFHILLALAIFAILACGGFGLRFYWQWHFERVQERIAEMPGSPFGLSGRYGDATVGVWGDVPPAAVELIESCGPIAGISLYPSEALSPAVAARLLALPGLQEVTIHTSDNPVPDDALESMCQAGSEIREIDITARGMSGPALSRLGKLPALESLKVSNREVTGGVVSLTAGFPALKQFDLEGHNFGPPVVNVEIAHLPRLEQLRVGYQRLAPANAPAAEISAGDLPNLDALTISYGQAKVFGCPRLRRLAVLQRHCDGRFLDEVATSSPEIRQLELESPSDFGLSEAAALSKFEHLESLELALVSLGPAALAAIAELPHLSRLSLRGCISPPAADGKPDWTPLGHCRQLEELVFASMVAMPDGLDWISDLKALRTLSLAECIGMDSVKIFNLGPDAHVEHVLEGCGRMPSLTTLMLEKFQIEKIAPTHRLGRLKVREQEWHSFGW